MATARQRRNPSETLWTGESREDVEVASAEYPVMRREIPAPPPALESLESSEGPISGMVLAGKYRVERVLGAGGNGVVAAAYDLQLHRRVAIKYLPSGAVDHPEVLERFAREARAAARIRGEHVARVLEVGAFEDGAPYIVLEYLEGVDLARHLSASGPLPIAHAVRHVLEACEALAEAHSARIVHRDLKPANLFLAKGPDRRKTIKVLDFGVSKIIDDPMTGPLRVLGSVAYMSPEQLRATHEVDLRTDIWSVGVILYELLSGKLPFGGSTLAQVAHAIKMNAPRPLSELRPDIPPQLEAVIARCMRTDRTKRYDSVLDLAIALAPFAEVRDRESVRTISGVLCGSVAPPSLGGRRHSSGSFDEALTHLVGPTLHIALDTPLALAVQPSPSSIVTRASRPRMGAPWLLVIGIAFAVILLIGITISLRRISAPAVAPSSRAEITLRIGADRPNEKVRIDDSPPIALPFETKVLRDERTHVLYFERDGRLVSTKLVRFTSDVDFVDVTMGRP